MPESVLATPPPPPPPQPSEAKIILRPEIIPVKNNSKKTIPILSGSPHQFDENDANERSSLRFDIVPPQLVATSSSVDPAKYCNLCDISVNSELHMRLHLAGAKHAKKLRQLGEPPYTEEPHTLSQCILDESILGRPKLKVIVNAVDSVAPAAPLIDYSVFRTPSGQYYCQKCNLSVTSEVTLSQHFASKRHLKTTKKK